MRRLLHEHSDFDTGSVPLPSPQDIPVPAVLEQVRSFICICRDERLVYINPSGARLLGFQLPEEALGREIASFYHPEYRHPEALSLAVFAEEEKLESMKFLRRDGTNVDVEVWVTRLANGGEPTYMVEARDITNHVRIARALTEREQRLDGIINTVADGIVTVNAEGIIGSFNRASEDIFGYAIDEVVGQPVILLLAAPDDGHLATDPVTGWPVGMEPGDEWTGRRKTGETFPMEVSVKEMRRGDDLAFTCIVRDVTAQKQAAERMHYMAHHDTLTGLPNRHLFADRLDEALKRAARSGKRAALMFVDLDEFKAINDTMGHDAGDRVLKGIAERLLGCVRESDTVARLGGDEFVVILEELEDVENAGLVAQNILDTLAEPLVIGGRKCTVGASIGIGIYPNHGAEVNDLMHCADEAMYDVKETGRNAYRFYRGAPARITPRDPKLHRLGWGN
jgi:diguanylate cyclase (GGDEF)-like protein/PAS domain S-box-containing protein